MSAPQHVVDSLVDWLADRPLGQRERAELLDWLREEMAKRYAGSEDENSPEDILVEHVMDEVGADDEFAAQFGVEADGLTNSFYALCDRAGWPT